MASVAAFLRARTALVCQNCRSISTTAPCNGKRNFRNFLLYNKRGSKQFKKLRNEGAYPELAIDTRGVRPVGHSQDAGGFKHVPEMIPELIVPDLEGFNLKPYVSYRAPEVVQSEFTSQDLFDAVYAKKIVTDFKEGKLDANGDPINASKEELLTPEEAARLAKKTGSDLFDQEKGVDTKLKRFNC